MLLLASVFAQLKTKVAAVLMFSVSITLTYLWDISSRPFDPTTLSLSDALLEMVLFLVFIIVPILAFVSGLALLRR